MIVDLTPQVNLMSAGARTYMIKRETVGQMGRYGSVCMYVCMYVVNAVAQRKRLDL